VDEISKKVPFCCNTVIHCFQDTSMQARGGGTSCSPLRLFLFAIKRPNQTRQRWNAHLPVPTSSLSGQLQVPGRAAVVYVKNHSLVRLVPPVTLWTNLNIDSVSRHAGVRSRKSRGLNQQLWCPFFNDLKAVSHCKCELFAHQKADALPDHNTRA
jgi:hypothetical protein